jgi:quercetin dioxygenase-like cupin family protein
MTASRVSAEGNVPPAGTSELSLDVVRLAAGDVAEVGSDTGDVLLFVFDGHGMVSSGGGHAVHAGSAAFVSAGEQGRLTTGADGIAAVRALVGARCDRHAPLGGVEAVVATDRVGSDSATGKRSFQLLYGPHNGSTRATLFVGYIPPGAAPWHFHLYDEIVWIWRGEGRFHTLAGSETIGPGSAFRIRPREVHVVENTSATEELVVVGLFTPAGSPSAAYLADDADVPYAIEAA